MVSRNRQQCDVYMCKDRLNQAENYSHLGVNVGDSNLQEILAQSIKVTLACCTALLRGPHILRQCKITIYQSILKLILLYG